MLDSLALPVEEMIPDELARELDVRDHSRVAIQMQPPRGKGGWELPRWTVAILVAALVLLLAVPVVITSLGNRDVAVTTPSTSSVVPPGEESRLELDLAEETLTGTGWLPNATVTGSISGMTSGQLTGVSDEEGAFRLEGLTGCCGNGLIELTDGVSTIRERIDWTLTVRRVDPIEDLIIGGGAEDLSITIRILDPVLVYEAEIGPDRESGAWLLDLDGVFDLEPGMTVEAAVTIGDVTIKHTSGVNVRAELEVDLDEGLLRGAGWGVGREVVIRVDDVESVSPGRTDQFGGLFADAEVNGFELRPGSVIVVSDGTTTREATIPLLTFDRFDPVRGIASGTTSVTGRDRIELFFTTSDGTAVRGAVTPTAGSWIVEFDPVVLGAVVEPPEVAALTGEASFWVRGPLEY